MKFIILPIASIANASSYRLQKDFTFLVKLIQVNRET